ncbi:MAG: VanZ family protein, partial [Clostridia bacterium]|nr:VanZ family protein [Clostridia bacterium]
LTGFGTTTITATTTDGENATTASLTLTVEKARFSDRVSDYFLVIRKAIGHFGAFFVLGLFGAVAYLFFARKGAAAKTAAFVLCVAAGFAVAGITEICQLPVFTSGRYCSFSDVLLDFNGYALAATIVFAVYAAVQAIRAVANKIKAKKQKS